MANITRRGTGGGQLQTGREWDPFRMMRDMLQWDPFREMTPFLGGRGGEQQALAFVPQFEVKETKDGYLFKADLPGVKESDLDISLSGNRLTVSGRREAEEKQEGETYYAYERTYGSFTRSFTLPEDVASDDVRADLKDGVLTLVVPRRPEQQPRKISVKSQSAQTTGAKAEGKLPAKA